MDEYIKEIKKMVGISTDMFYQQNKNLGYKVLLLLLDKLSEFIVYIEKENIEGIYDIVIADLKNILSECLSALEGQDIVLLADILKYDLMEKLEGI